MEKHIPLEQISLTSEEGFKKSKEVLNELQDIQEKAPDKQRHEYDFMDGLLGCVKV